MHCCTHTACGTGRVFSRVARRSARRYARAGLDKTQRHLLEGMRRAGLTGASILEIGCGVGALHQSMLSNEGSTRAVGVDLSQDMLNEAKKAAMEKGLSDRVEYRLGDFVELAHDLEAVDVTVLDKVVCCYPDAATLLRRSLVLTRHVYALTYPRDHLFNRAAAALGAFVMWLVRAQFRPQIHPPKQIDETITAYGFRGIYAARSAIWWTKVFVREREPEEDTPDTHAAELA